MDLGRQDREFSEVLKIGTGIILSVRKGRENSQVCRPKSYVLVGAPKESNNRGVSSKTLPLPLFNVPGPLITVGTKATGYKEG